MVSREVFAVCGAVSAPRETLRSGGKGCCNPRSKSKSHLLLEPGVLFLGVNEVEENVEGPGEHEGEEEAEAGEVDISLRAMARVNNSSRCETT